MMLQYPCDICVLPVYPAEDPGVGGVGGAVGDPVCPVLGQPVLLGDGPQPRAHHRHLHHDVWLVRADVVPPQRGQRLVHAAIAWNYKLRVNWEQFCVIFGPWMGAFS